MELEGETSMRVFAILIAAILFLAACGDSHDYSPKPRGYFRIELPKKEYREYVSKYPFTFQYPTYANMQLVQKSRLPARLLNMEYLLNMNFPQFDASIYFSYDKISSKTEFNRLVEDARKLAFKNTVKSTGIDQGIIRIPEHHVYGIYYTIDGNAASSVQFFLTDSTKNYLRGALYFNTAPRLDSIQPVLNFVKQDIGVMIKTFRWK